MNLIGSLLSLIIVSAVVSFAPVPSMAQEYRADAICSCLEIGGTSGITVRSGRRLICR